MEQPTPLADDVRDEVSKIGNFVVAAHRCHDDVELFQLLAETLPGLVPADRTSVTMLDATGSKLEVYSLSGKDGFLSVGDTLSIEDTAAGAAIRNKRVSICDYRKSSSGTHVRKLRQLGIVCGISTPIYSGDVVRGTINVASVIPDRYSKADMDTLEVIGSVISACLHRETLMKRLQLSADFSNQLNSKLRQVTNASLAISQAVDKKSVLGILQDTGRKLFDIETVWLANLDEGMPAIEAICVDDALDWSASPPRTIEADNVLKPMIQAGNLHLIDDAAEIQPRPYDQGAAHEDRSALVMPLARKGSETEFILCTSKASTHNLREDLELLEILHNSIRFAMERIDAHAIMDARLHRDTLTGLHNREYFGNYLDRFIASADSPGLALVLVDLDKFKEINDGFGHLSGDATLIKFGEGLQELAGEDAVVARIGGDEFALLLPFDPNNREPITQLMERLESASIKINLGGQNVDIGFSAGTAIYPGDANDKTTLMRNADLALYDAKARASAKALFFEQPMASRFENSRLMITEFKNALQCEEIIPHYQMLVNLRTGNVEGLEALARWNHPRKGLISPGAFQDIFADSSLTDMLARRMFRCVADDIVRWRKAGVPYESVGINIELSDQANRDLFVALKYELDQRDIPLRDIALEVTENTELGPRSEKAMELLHEVRAHGMYVALDDFGTGYSSLTNLTRIPMTALKLDNSFVQGMFTQSSGLAIASSILDLASKLNVVSIAEGIETVEQMDALRALNCDLGQGHLFSHPLPADKIADAIARQHQRRLSVYHEPHLMSA